MKAISQFDYIIVGSGLSGLHLSYSFLNDKYFENHKILIIDKLDSIKEDNFFSFWERGIGKWDSIIKNKWSKGKFFSKYGEINMDFSSYNYKTLISSDFSKYVKDKLKKNKNFKFVKDTVLKIRNEKNNIIVVGNKRNYQASHVFDSSIQNKIKKELYNYPSLKQHFLGWVVKTKNNEFDEKSFVFMDYRIRDKNKTAFTYVLPLKKNKALIEYTYFSKDVCKKKVYEDYLKKYLIKYYNDPDYEIIKSEFGVIPMTSYPFYKNSTKNITKIGAAGGWIKPSSGYSFKICEINSLKIIDNIKKGKKLSIKPKKKYQFLDKILLGVLSKYNHKGEIIFYKMIKRNSTSNVLRFLYEKSSLFEEIKIIISLRSIDFIKVLIKSIFRKAL